MQGYAPWHGSRQDLKILVTGAGALLGQGVIRAIRASKLNATVIAVDPSPLSAGLYWADFLLSRPHGQPH